jgi:hypothetical protein
MRLLRGAQKGCKNRVGVEGRPRNQAGIVATATASNAGHARTPGWTDTTRDRPPPAALERQADAERAAHARLAVDLDRPAVLLDESPGAG